MQPFEPAYYWDGDPVYVINLLDDRTAVCPSCKELLSNSQGLEGHLSVVCHTIQHLCQQQGCGHPERRTFKVESYLKLGDLPMIPVEDYRCLLPFLSMHETVASGVAKVLGYQLGTAQAQLSQMCKIRTAQDTQLDTVWKDKEDAEERFKVMRKELKKAKDEVHKDTQLLKVRDAELQKTHAIKEEVQAELQAKQTEAVNAKREVQALTTKLQATQEVLKGKEESLRQAKNKVLVKDAELQKVHTQDEQISVLEKRLKVQELEAGMDKKRTYEKFAACVGNIEKAASIFYETYKIAKK